MEDWIDRLAAALGEDPLSETETTRLLGVSDALAAALDTLERLLPASPPEARSPSAE